MLLRAEARWSAADRPRAGRALRPHRAVQRFRPELDRVIDGAHPRRARRRRDVVLAQVNPNFLRRLAVPLWMLGVMLLLVVDITGYIGKGAQRWLDLGFIRFQPSEIMKLAVPMMCAWYLHERPLPPDCRIAGMLRAHDPGARGARGRAARPRHRRPDRHRRTLVVIMAGLQLRIIVGARRRRRRRGVVGWQYFLHDYQRKRVLTFLDPQTDPLGAGYHIIQSQIAIGSGGVFGKGWMNGSQAQLEFLPERSTDFIFAVIGEEFGLLGLAILLLLYLFVVGRALYLAMQTQDTFARLLGRQPRAHVLRVRVHQRGHGERTAAGGRRAAAARQLRRHIDGDPAGGLRYSDVAVLAPEARRLVMRAFARTAVALLLRLARSALRGRLVHRPHAASISIAPEIQPFVEATSPRRNKMQPLDVLSPARQGRAAAEDHRADQQAGGKVSPWWEYRARFLTEKRIAEGAQFCASIARASSKARKEPGVPPEYMVAIIGVETYYGRITGKLPRARCAGDARLRLSAARRILPQGARAVRRCCRARNRSTR